MESTKKVITDIVEDKLGSTGKYLFDIGLVIIEKAYNKKQIEKKKLTILNNKNCDMSYQYNEVILKNFVPRKFRYYGSEKYIPIRKVMKEIESKRYFQKNIIITGQAGVGKSTALKWLFVNSYMPENNYIYLYAKMFDEWESLDEVLTEIESLIPNDKCSIIFFDGLDELKCIKGNAYEFNKFINFFDKNSNSGDKKRYSKFIISTRPEHFEFNNMIIKNNTTRPLDNYLIIELQILTNLEAFKMCKSIKKMYEFDKENGLSHFINKWPSEDMRQVPLKEAEYIKMLKKYLYNSSMESSLLNIPLLCRYGYQIISEWNSEGQRFLGQCNKTQSDRIEHVLEVCIKWEFHDKYTCQTENEYGRNSLKEYKERVWEFLIEIAGIMGNNQTIDREQWCNLKGLKVEEINEAYCVLQEIKNEDKVEKLGFVHSSFQNYFLACYYASMLNGKKSEQMERDKKFSSLFRANSEFAVMYIEQLMKGENELAKKVCKELLKLKDGNIENIIEYAKGDLRFVYNPTISFTIEEYLTVFPDGIFIYAGIIFDRCLLDDLRSNRIFKIMNPKCLAEFEQAVISKSNYVKGMYFDLFDTEYQFLLFYVYEDEKFKFIGGYHYNEDYFKQRIERLSSQVDISYDSIKSNFTIKEILKEMEIYRNKDNVFERFMDISKNFIKFMGEKNNYWCLLHDSSLYVYQKNSENEIKMTNMFKNGQMKHPFEYINLYGTYNSMISDNNNIHCYEKSKILFLFNAKQIISNKSNYFLDKYYKIHFGNIMLLREKMNNKNCLMKDISNLYSNIEMYEYIEEIINKSQDDKMYLHLCDEKLITYYILEEQKEMLYLAKNTLSLCDKYEHFSGVKLREFLVREDICFNGEDLNRVYEFAQNYIWLQYR